MPLKETRTIDRKAWSIDEACQLLGGLSRKSVYDLIRDGQLRSVMVSGRRLVPDKAIDDLLARESKTEFVPFEQ